jgi:hypothetical protein
VVPLSSYHELLTPRGLIPNIMKMQFPCPRRWATYGRRIPDGTLATHRLCRYSRAVLGRLRRLEAPGVHTNRVWVNKAQPHTELVLRYFQKLSSMRDSGLSIPKYSSLTQEFCLVQDCELIDKCQKIKILIYINQILGATVLRL